MRAVAKLCGQKGVSLTLSTTAPGLQAYDGAGLDSRPFPGHMGMPYGPRAGLALEPQHWPDAAGRADFPSILLRPDTGLQPDQRMAVQPDGKRLTSGEVTVLLGPKHRRKPDAHSPANPFARPDRNLRRSRASVWPVTPGGPVLCGHLAGSIAALR